MGAGARRSADWLKIKTARRQEAVIVGFTAPRRSRPYFGALVLAVGDRDGWRYVGHVGTGFSYSALNELCGSALWRISLNRCAVDQHGRAAGEFPDSFLRLSP
jgi:ATP-dependent DNA ligase